MNKKVTQGIVDDAQKFTFLVREYPKKPLIELTNLMAMPGIDVNLAIWHAVDQGWIADPSKNDDPKDQFVHLGEMTPAEWEFGPTIVDLEAKLLLSFDTLSGKETDLQWEFLSEWLVGYPARDVMIVLKKMLADGTLEHYFVADPEDPESVYEFYTLPENRKYLWGGKSFKVQPTEEAPEPQDEQTNDAADEAAESEE